MWSAFAIFNARFLKHHPEINSSDWSSLLGIGAFITIIPVWFLLTPEHGIPQRLFATRYLLWMLMAGFGGSWLAACFWNAASKRLPASLAGQLIVSETIFSLLYGYIYDHRLPTLIEAAAALLLIGGVLTGIRAFRKVEKISA
jgi:drug/metabolite transporter (DMT)-like permease